MTFRFEGRRRVAFAAAAAVAVTGCALDATAQRGVANGPQLGRVTAVIDGDTIKVSTRRGLRTVRLIGIDTPETKKPGSPIECGGPEATSSMLELGYSRPTDHDGDGLFDSAHGRGRRVVLRSDPTQDRVDRYGRVLAYVDVVGGPSVQVEQLRRGWADVYVYRGRPFRQLQAFRAASNEARTAQRGVWGLCPADFHSEVSDGR